MKFTIDLIKSKTFGTWGGLPVVAIGPKGGKIVGYKHGKPIYAGSTTANKMVAMAAASDKEKKEAVGGWLYDVLDIPSKISGNFVYMSTSDGASLAAFKGLKVNNATQGLASVKVQDLLPYVGKSLPIPKADEEALVASSAAGANEYEESLENMKELPAGKYGGSHGNKLFEAPSGKKYVFKHTNKTIAMAELAASRIGRLIAPDLIPTVQEAEHKTLGHGVLVEVVEGEILNDDNHKNPPVTALAKHVQDVVTHHVIDWLVGNHDAHAGNFVVGEKGMVAIDKGQAWKYLGKDKLDTDFSPNPSGTIYAKFWDVVAPKHKAAATAALGKALKAASKITEDQIRSICAPYVSALSEWKDMDSDASNKMLDAIAKRLTNLEKDWDKFASDKLDDKIATVALKTPEDQKQVFVIPQKDLPPPPKPVEPVEKVAGWPMTKGSITVHHPGVPVPGKWPKGYPGAGFQVTVKFKKQDYSVEFVEDPTSNSGIKVLIQAPDGKLHGFGSPNQATRGIYMLSEGLFPHGIGKAPAINARKMLGVLAFEQELLGPLVADVAKPASDKKLPKKVSPDNFETMPETAPKSVKDPKEEGAKLAGMSSEDTYIALKSYPVGTQILYNAKGALPRLLVKTADGWNWGILDEHFNFNAAFSAKTYDDVKALTQVSLATHDYVKALNQVSLAQKHYTKGGGLVVLEPNQSASDNNFETMPDAPTKPATVSSKPGIWDAATEGALFKEAPLSQKKDGLTLYPVGTRIVVYSKPLPMVAVHTSEGWRFGSWNDYAAGNHLATWGLDNLSKILHSEATQVSNPDVMVHSPADKLAFEPPIPKPAPAVTKETEKAIADGKALKKMFAKASALDFMDVGTRIVFNGADGEQSVAIKQSATTWSYNPGEEYDDEYDDEPYTTANIVALVVDEWDSLEVYAPPVEAAPVPAPAPPVKATPPKPDAVVNKPVIDHQKNHWELMEASHKWGPELEDLLTGYPVGTQVSFSLDAEFAPIPNIDVMKQGKNEWVSFKAGPSGEKLVAKVYTNSELAKVAHAGDVEGAWAFLPEKDEAPAPPVKEKPAKAKYKASKSSKAKVHEGYDKPFTHEDIGKIRSTKLPSFGKSLVLPTQDVRDGQVTVRRVRGHDGKYYTEVTGTLSKFTESSTNPVQWQAATVGFPSCAKEHLGGTIVDYDKEAGATQINGTSFKESGYAAVTADGIKMERHDGRQVYKGTFRARIPESMDLRQGMQSVFNALNIPNALEDNEAATQLRKKAALAKSLMGANGWQMEMGVPDYFSKEEDLDKLIDLLVSDSQKLLDQMELREVFPGHSAWVIPSDEERFKKAGWKFAFRREAGVDSLYFQILQGVGWASQKAKLTGGNQTEGWSPAQDISSGGADVNFWRVQKGDGEGTALPTCAVGNYVIAHPRVFARLDWRRYGGDAYGETMANSNKRKERYQTTGKLDHRNEICWNGGTSFNDVACVVVTSIGDKKNLIHKLQLAGVSQVNGVSLDSFIEVAGSKKELESLHEKIADKLA